MSTTERLIAKFWTTPVGAKLLEEEATEQRADRQASIKSLAELTQREITETARLNKLLDAAKNKREAALEALKQAQFDFNQAFGQVQGFSARSEQERHRHQAALEATAPPAIDAFIEQLGAEFSRLRHVSPTTVESRSKHLATLGARIVTSNLDSIRARMAAISPARDLARQLKYQDLSVAQFEARLEQIWATLPAVQSPEPV